MDDATRTKAEDKLAKIVNKIGYPSKWRSYEGLAIDRASFLANAERASAFEVRRELAKVGKPVDKEEWEMTPPTVNAYYEPTMNEMVFPAGILQEPFYGKQQTPALNFGAIGMVVGHELTHGFDDEGRQFDAEGNLRDWWSPAVGAEFDKRAACVEHQFDDYVPIDDMHIKGKLTLGENIADLGGPQAVLCSISARGGRPLGRVVVADGQRIGVHARAAVLRRLRAGVVRELSTRGAAAPRRDQPALAAQVPRGRTALEPTGVRRRLRVQGGDRDGAGGRKALRDSGDGSAPGSAPGAVVSKGYVGRRNRHGGHGRVGAAEPRPSTA